MTETKSESSRPKTLAESKHRPKSTMDVRTSSKGDVVKIMGKMRRRGSFFKVGGLDKRRKSTSSTPKEAKKKSTPGVVDAQLEEEETSCEDDHSIATPEFESLACELCNLVFTSKAKKENHMQFSSLHEINVKNESVREVEEVEPPAVLIFTGCKYIVRHHMQLEVQIYEQKPTLDRKYCRLAIRCTDMDSDRKFTLIFLNNNLIEYYSTKSVALSRLSADVLHAESNTRTRNSVAASRHELTGAFILHRLAYNEADGIQFVHLTGDKFDRITVDGPADIPGMGRQLKRRGSAAEEFLETEKKFESDQKKLVDARVYASYLAEKTKQSIDKLHRLLNPRRRQEKKKESQKEVQILP